MQWNLIRLRKKKELHQGHLAEILGLSSEGYGRKERGETEFTADEMFKLSDYFGLPLEQIFLPRNIGDNEFLKIVKVEA